LAISNSPMDEGQTQALTAYVYNGASPYTYNIMVYNAFGLVANQLTVNALTYNTFIFTQNSAWGFGTFTVNTIVKDSNSPVTTVSNTMYYTVDAPTTPPAIAPAPPVSVDVGQPVTFTATESTGLAPYTYNILIYNPSNVLTFSAYYVYDVVVQHSNGLLTGYKALANTNLSRGQALLNALSSQNLSSGDKIYLAAETYDVESQLDLSGGGLLSGVQLLGSGKYKTTILSASAGPEVVWAGTNSVTSDLTLKSYTGPSGTMLLWGAYGSAYPITNAIIRNVYMSGPSDGIYEADSFSSPQVFTGNAFNITTNSGWDSVQIDAFNGGDSFGIFDSNFISTAFPAQNSGYAARGIVISDTMTIVNTLVTASNGIQANVGIKVIGGTVTVYGGSVTTSGANALDLNNSSPFPLYINATLSYNSLKTSGTINTIKLGSTPYGAYSYPKGPQIPQNVANILVQVPSNTISFQQTLPTGTWSLNAIVTDSFGLTAFNTITYTVNPALTDTWSASVDPVTTGSAQTLTASTGSTGSSPWVYNILVYNAVGALVYSSLSSYTGSATNAVSFIQDSTWGTGTFTANLVLTDSAYAHSSVTNTLTYTANLGAACYISLSTATENFGSVGSNQNVPTNIGITDTDSGGSAIATILIAGGVGDATSWYDNSIWLGTSPSNQIGITNTLYSATSQSGYTGTSITNSISSTGILIPNPSGGSASNTVYLGFGVPSGAPKDAYTTNIVIENSC